MWLCRLCSIARRTQRAPTKPPPSRSISWAYLITSTSDLDEETERQIMDQFRNLNRKRGVTLVLVTHNLRLAELTDRIIHIAGGRLAS